MPISCFYFTAQVDTKIVKKSPTMYLLTWQNVHAQRRIYIYIQSQSDFDTIFFSIENISVEYASNSFQNLQLFAFN